MQGLVVTELLVEGALEVVAVTRARLKEAEEGVTDGHAEHCTPCVYVACIAVTGSSQVREAGNLLGPGNVGLLGAVSWWGCLLPGVVFRERSTVPVGQVLIVTSGKGRIGSPLSLGAVLAS
ncbi:hypothetical protein GCM10010277_79840 [Streptomyces longisporoflavus]|nr:hypothetical protein GCM10010277_79840 [Streptomyces longisporoflavus]